MKVPENDFVLMVERRGLAIAGLNELYVPSSHKLQGPIFMARGDMETCVSLLRRLLAFGLIDAAHVFVSESFGAAPAERDGNAQLLLDALAHREREHDDLTKRLAAL